MHGKRVIGLDWETSKIPFFHPWQEEAFPVSLCITDATGFVKTWIFNHKEDEFPKPHNWMIKEIQHEIDKSYKMVGHNLKFDLNWLTFMGIDTSKVKLWCTQLAEYLIEGHRKLNYTLGKVSERRGIPAKDDKVKPYWVAGYETDQIPLSILIPYGERDTINTLMLYQIQLEDVKKLDMVTLLSMETEKLRVLSYIECNGMKLHKDRALKYVDAFTKSVSDIDIQIKKIVGEEDINLSSNDDLSAILYGGNLKRTGKEKVQRVLKGGKIKEYERNCVIEVPLTGMGFTPPEGAHTKKKGVFKTGKEILTQLKGRTKDQRKFLKLLNQRSGDQKALQTFIGKAGTAGLINKIQADGCVHPSFNQCVTRTGRLSSSDPNGQNLPRGKTSPIKKIFIPKFDMIGNADLSQIEWRVAAFLSQDPIIISEILGGVDYHLDNAIKFFGDAKYRTDAKVFGFRLLYGGVAYGMFKDPLMPNFSLKKWERICKEYTEKYERLAEWQNENVAIVQEHGKLRLPSGRLLTFDKHLTKNGVMEYSRREILNYPVQAFATADIMGLAMNIIYARMMNMKLKSQIICQVHDSLVFDAFKEEIEQLAQLSINVFNRLPEYMKKVWNCDFNIPLTGEFETGPSYGDMDLYKLAA